MARRGTIAERPAELPEGAAALLAMPPAGFTAARDALARELAAHGDPSAAAVRKIRRPVGMAWLLNHLARQEHGAVDALLAAGDRLRGAQAAALAGQGADAFRSAEEDLRRTARSLRLAAAPALAAAGKAGAPAALAHVEVMLRYLAGAPAELRERFRAGLLEREPEVEAVGLAGVLPAASPVGAGRAGKAGGRAGAPRREAQLEPGQAEEAAGRGGAAAARRDQAERRKAEALERARSREEARAKANAARALARAEARAQAARKALAAAEANAQEARQRLAAAQAEVKRLGGGDGS